MTKQLIVLRNCLAAMGLAGALWIFPAGTRAQAPATAAQTAVSRQRGTVKAIAGSTLTLTTDDGHDMSVAVMPNAKIMQLAPGSTDLKSAQPITLADVTAGDRVLVVGAAGADVSSFKAGRVILMKSTDIAAQHAREEADWQRRGSGGIVTAVDTSSGTSGAGAIISMSARGKVVAVKTTPSTTFRRYAGDSVKFEDAKIGTLGQIQAGDQMRVRGGRSADGAGIDAEEIVSGRFENLSGTLTAVDASAGTVSLNDLATKKPVTVTLTANSAIHILPPASAAALTGGGSRPAASQNAGAATAGGGGSQPGEPRAEQRTPKATSSTTGTPAGEGSRRSGGDLSQIVARLPRVSVADLHVGDAVLVVATPPSPGTPAVTAIELVSGVQSLLSAAQGSAPAVTLSPWSLGQNGADSGGTQ